MNGFVEYMLARVGQKDKPLVLLVVPRDAFVGWSPDPWRRPTGKVQWWYRRAGLNRWLRYGEPMEYV